MAYFGAGYSRGYARAQEEYRKKEYETELKKAAEIYQEQTGLPWTEVEEQEFAHLWRLKLIDPPPAFHSMRLADQIQYVGLPLLFITMFICGLIGVNRNPYGDSLSFSLTFLIGGFMLSWICLYHLWKKHCAHREIRRIGVDAWRELTAKRQEENEVAPWNAGQS